MTENYTVYLNSGKKRLVTEEEKNILTRGSSVLWVAVGNDKRYYWDGSGWWVKKLTNKESMAKLIEAYPYCFSDTPKPLEIGIHKRIVSDGTLTKDETRRVLQWYCGSVEYLFSVLSSQFRVNLEGGVGDEITEDEKKFAVEKLRILQQEFLKDHNEGG